MKEIQDELNTPNKANVSLAVRNVALAKKIDSRIFWSFVCISCFSVSACIGYVGAFLLFQ